MEIIKTEFKGLFIIKPTIHMDDRGYFLETFNHKEFKEKTGIECDFIQDNESESKLGVLRGLHYQDGVYAQDKLVRVTEGSVMDVVVDMRPDSETFGRYFKIILDGNNKTQLFVPKGFAHGFIALTDNVKFVYKCSGYYNPNFEGGIHPFDKTLNIDWRLPNDKVLLSDKDDLLPSFSEVIRKKVLVIGASGQLGRSIHEVDGEYDELSITYLTSDVLDITKVDDINNYFSKRHFDYVINCAAYTDVDEAETIDSNNIMVNAWGPFYLAKACEDYNTTMIQISSDYVFDGKNDLAYLIDDKVSPINEYGKAKVKSEFAVSSTLKKHYIIRTSWLFSKYGNNFAKTIVKLSKTKDKISVIGNQVGKPTYAGDLAHFILDSIIVEDKGKYGTYHYAGDEELSWFKFANKIIEATSSSTKVIRDDNYGNYKAKRPNYSSLDTKFTSDVFQVTMESLEHGINEVINKFA